MSTSSNPIVITGVGAVLPTGGSAAQHWARALAGQTGVSAYAGQHLRSALIPCFGKVDAQLSLATKEAVPPRLRRYCTDATCWGLQAIAEALGRSGLELGAIPEERRGIFTAQGDYMFVSFPSFLPALREATRDGALDRSTFTRQILSGRGCDPFMAVKALSNNLLAVASLQHRLRGDCGAFAQNESGAAAALSAASFSLRHGYCDVALVVGSGSCDEAFKLREHHDLLQLSPCAAGRSSLRSFDRGRDGTILGEGAVALVLERAAAVSARGGLPLAELSAVACTNEQAADGSAASAYARCLQRAGVEEARLAELDFVCASGLGTQRHDALEAQLLEVALGEHWTRVPVTCLRPLTGSLGSVSLLSDVMTTGLALREGCIPPIAHLTQPLRSELGFVMGQAQPRRCRAAACFSMGFDEFRSAVLLRSAVLPRSTTACN